MTAASTPPLAVGQEGRVAVLLEGVVTALGVSSVEIAGWTLPTRLGDGVRTVSLADDALGSLTTCDREHCDSSDCECVPDCISDHCGEDCYGGTDLPEILRVVERVHDERHTGSFRHCADPVCAVLQDVEP